MNKDAYDNSSSQCDTAQRRVHTAHNLAGCIRILVAHPCSASMGAAGRGNCCGAHLTHLSGTSVQTSLAYWLFVAAKPAALTLGIQVGVLRLNMRRKPVRRCDAIHVTACDAHHGFVHLISHRFPCCHCKQGGADVLKAAIVRPSDTSKPAFLPEDQMLAVKQSANLTYCRGAPGRFSQFGA